MAWPKGKPRPVGAGRQLGTPNKKTNLFAICDEVGLNVFKEMVSLANKTRDAELRFAKLKEIAPYLYAKKKETLNLTDHNPDELLNAAEAKLQEIESIDDERASET
jgi:hypothetical protein